MQLTFSHDIQDNDKTFSAGSEFWIVMFVGFFVEGCCQTRIDETLLLIAPMFEQVFITLQLVIVAENILVIFYWVPRLQ